MTTPARRPVDGEPRPGRVSIPAHPDSTLDLPLADVDLTIAKSFAWSVRQYSDRPALVFEGRRWTYADLGADVEHCARALVAVGVGKGTRVGIMLGNRPEFVILVYAVAMVGGVSVLVSTFSTAEETDWILRHSDVSLLVMHRGVRGRDVASEFTAKHHSACAQPRGALALPELPFLRRVVVVDNTTESSDTGFETWDELLALGDDVQAGAVSARVDEVVPTDDAVLLYTSGSSSHPKGVLHVHRAPTMQSFRHADAMAIGADDRTWSTFPFFWTAGWAAGFAGPLWVGACVVLQEFYDPEEAVELLRAERVTCIRQTVHDETRLVAALDTAGQALPDVTVGVVTEPLRARTGVSYAITEWCGWGMSETFTNATQLPFDAPYLLRRETVGAPVPGDEIRICDPTSGAPLATGEVGEIRVAGLSVMRGYYKSDPMFPADDAGFLRTGDSGYLRDDGLLVFTGRLDRIIKTSGVNVSPTELEDHLQEWGRLGNCGITAVPHPTRSAAVVACAVQAPGAPVSDDEVTEFLRSRVAAYKVPLAIVWLTDEEMPVTSGGKINQALLPEVATRKLLERDLDAAWRDRLLAELIDR